MRKISSALVAASAAGFAALHQSRRAAFATPVPVTSTVDRVDVTGDDFVELDLGAIKLDHHLIHSGLRGEDKVHAYSLALSRNRKRLRATAALGSQICGHPHIVHGGALATLLDDALGTLFLSSGHNGFTANLNVQYRKPVPAGANVVVVAEIDRTEASASNPSRLKVFISGKIIDATTGAVYTEASSVFVTKEVTTSGGKSNKFFKQVGAAAEPDVVAAGGSA